MNRLGIIISAVCLAAVSAHAENVELKLSTPKEAALTERFCLHESPDVDSEKIICLEPGALLTLVARLKDKEEVDGEEGYWYKAEVAGGASGWVFDAYFSFEPLPDPDGGAAGGAP